MEITRNTKIIISILIALVLVGIYIFIDRQRKDPEDFPKNENPVATTTSKNTATTTIPGTDITIVGDDYTIEVVKINQKAAVNVSKPDLSRPVLFGVSTNYSEDVKAVYTQKIQELQASLRKDPTNLMNWIYLGLYQKSIGDYSGAAITWKYVAAVAEKDYISYANLGDLYGYYLKDNVLAETYFKKAIENGPKQAYLYIQLATFYMDVYKDKSKALSTINLGLQRIPNDPSLIEFKNNLQ